MAKTVGLCPVRLSAARGSACSGAGGLLSGIFLAAAGLRQTSGKGGAALNILIVDDHPIAAYGLSALLSAILPSARVVCVHTVVQARAFIDSGPSLDWLFLDIHLPEDPGKDFCRSLLETPWVWKMVLVSAAMPLDILRLALAAGARGFMPKSADPVQIRGCLETIQAGGVFIPEALARLLNSDTAPHEGGRALSPRLLEVQDLLLRGAANKAIARGMNISEHTVKEYVSSLLAYHRVKNRLELVLKLQAQS